MKLRTWIFFAALGGATVHAQDLPKKGPSDSMDFEPKLMLDGPGAPGLDAAAATPAPEERIRRCEADVTVAEQRAADSEQLFKEGILAKVEVEARFLRVILTRKRLADAKADAAAAHVNDIGKAVADHTATQADADAAANALKTAQAADAAVTQEWNGAQLNAARLDLERKRKLYSEGAGSEHEVQAAEDRLALLTGTAE